MPRRQWAAHAHAHDLHASLGDNIPNPFERGRRQEPQTSLPRCLIDGEHDSAVPSLNTLEDTRHPYVDFLRSFWLVSRRCL